MYKIYTTETEAKAVNHQKAVDECCTGTTKYWWSMIKHEDGRCALKVKRGELDDLKTEAELDADGWFPEEINI